MQGGRGDLDEMCNVDQLGTKNLVCVVVGLDENLVGGGWMRKKEERGGGERDIYAQTPAQHLGANLGCHSDPCLTLRRNCQTPTSTRQLARHIPTCCEVISDSASKTSSIIGVNNGKQCLNSENCLRQR